MVRLGLWSIGHGDDVDHEIDVGYQDIFMLTMEYEWDLKIYLYLIGTPRAATVKAITDMKLWGLARFSIFYSTPKNV